MSDDQIARNKTKLRELIQSGEPFTLEEAKVQIGRVYPHCTLRESLEMLVDVGVLKKQATLYWGQEPATHA